MDAAIRPEDVPGLSDSNPAAPVLMVNLLKFKKSDGLDSYMQYVAGIATLLEQAGATVSFAGSM